MMTEQQADFLYGLLVVENELEAVIQELDEMQDRRDIPILDRVSLDPLQWALSKLADDLHEANVEIRDSRLREASAEREEERRLALEKQLNHVTAERDHLREQLERIDPAAVSCATAGEPIGAVDLSSLPPSEWTSWELDQTIEGIDGARIVLSEDNLGDWPKLYRQGFRRKEPATEPYEWQVGDEIRCELAGWTQPVAYRDAAGWLAIEGNGWFPQFEWERQGWRLHRKASDIQQVERYTAVTEPISDSFGADGEGVVE